MPAQVLAQQLLIEGLAGVGGTRAASPRRPARPRPRDRWSTGHRRRTGRPARRRAAPGPAPAARSPATRPVGSPEPVLDVSVLGPLDRVWPVQVHGAGVAQPGLLHDPPGAGV